MKKNTIIFISLILIICVLLFSLLFFNFQSRRKYERLYEGLLWHTITSWNECSDLFDYKLTDNTITEKNNIEIIDDFKELSWSVEDTIENLRLLTHRYEKANDELRSINSMIDFFSNIYWTLDKMIYEIEIKKMEYNDLSKKIDFLTAQNEGVSIIEKYMHTTSINDTWLVMLKDWFDNYKDRVSSSIEMQSILGN